MSGIWKRLFGGGDEAKVSPPGEGSPRQPSTPVPPNGAGDVAGAYFRLGDEMVRLRKEGQWAEIAKLAKANHSVLLGFIEGTLKEFGDVPPGSLFLSLGVRAFAIMNDRSGLDRIRRTVTESPALEPWHPLMEEAYATFDAARKLEALVQEEPGILQTKARDALALGDGPNLSSLAKQLHEAGRIRRERAGRTYALHPVG